MNFMETIFFEGDILELPEEKESKKFPSISLYDTKAKDFINAFLYAGGYIINGSIHFSFHDENYLLWLKKSLESFGITCNVKNIYKGAVGNPSVWILDTEIYVELITLEKEWFYSVRKKCRRRPPKFNGTPLALFLWYLWHGRIYEYKQFRSNECPQFISKGISIEKSDTIAVILNNADIKYFKKGTSGYCIKEPEHEKFFAYICEVPFLIPECFHHKFPVEFIQRNKDYVLTYKPE